MLRNKIKIRIACGLLATLSVIAPIIANSALILAVAQTETAPTDTQPSSEFPRAGAVNIGSSSTLNVRIGAGTNFARLQDTRGNNILLRANHSVTLLDRVLDASGAGWFRISFTLGGNSYTGYAHGDFIRTINNNPGNTGNPANFEEMMEQQGFPEDYRVLLREVHELFPEWQFIAQHTGLNWDLVMREQYRFSRNLVHREMLFLRGRWVNTRSSWMSLQPGAFNWATNSWVRVEPNWHQVSQELLAFFVDPRNFLNPTDMFQFELLTFDERTHTVDAVEALLRGTFMYRTRLYAGPNMTYGQAFVSIGRDLNISPLHLASRVRQEQGTTRGAIVNGRHAQHPGFFNYFNIGATAPSGTNADIIRNALQRARNSGWSDSYLSLRGGAAFLNNSYISRGQNTLYLQKFNVAYESGRMFWHQFMTNVSGAYSEGRSVRNAHVNRGTMDTAFTFRIPIFYNMPESTSIPEGTGNPNFKLNNLAVSGFQLSPTFNMSHADYTLVVPFHTNTITVTGQVIAPTSRAEGFGTHSLSRGSNEIQIVVTAQNNTQKTYTILVYREGDGSVVCPYDPEVVFELGEGLQICSEHLNNDNGINNPHEFLFGIAPNTTRSQLLERITLVNGLLVIYDRNGNSRNDGPIGTGDRVAIYDLATEKLLYQYVVVIFGDVSGRGVVDIIDFAFVRNHVLGTASLANEFLLAGSLHQRNGEVTIIDFAFIRNHVLGTAILTNDFFLA